jgi:CheY-like chemotaxis protein/HPt (histidine-containing phosphotransfer) domain-containing protein
VQVIREAHTTSQLPRSLYGTRVMIVHHNRTERRFFLKKLAMAGATGIEAEDLDQARARLVESPCQVVLLNYQDSIDEAAAFVHEIRRRPGLEHVRFVLLTRLRDWDTARKDNPAFDAFLLKPAKQSQISRLLRQVLERRESSEQVVLSQDAVAIPSLDPGTTESRTRRLLVVEDNTVNQKVAEVMLTKAGYRVDIAANGLEAIEAVSRVRYDAVLMDCMMPEMDGFEATRVIRRLERNRTHVPIIALTAAAMEQDRERCFAAGMDGFVVKPIDRRAVLETLARFTTRREQPPPSHSAVASIGPQEIYASTELQLKVGGDANVVRDLFAAWFREAPGQIRDLEAAVRAGDIEKARVLAGAIRTSARNLSAKAIATVARRIELEIQRADQDTISALMERLRDEYELAEVLLKRRLGLG